MAELQPLELLKKKAGLLSRIEAVAGEQNRLIKAKQFENIAALDDEKAGLLAGLEEIDRAAGAASYGKTSGSKELMETIESINTSFNRLIKVEKENEILLTEAAGALSGSHIQAYKTYKYMK